MARDFAPNYTPRYKVFYTVGSKKHSFQIRLASGIGKSGLTPYVTKVGAFLAALAPVLFADWQLLNAKFAAQGSDIFLPAALPAAPTGSVAANTRTTNQHANQLRFEALSNGGSRVNISLYGSAFRLEAGAAVDYRILNAEDTQIQAATGVLNENSPSFFGIDTHEANWYSYANIKPNDYYVHRTRG